MVVAPAKNLATGNTGGFFAVWSLTVLLSYTFLCFLKVIRVFGKIERRSRAVKLSETRNKDGSIVAERLRQFIAERKNEAGDGDALERTIHSMAGTSKEAPEASSPSDCDD